MRASVIFHIPGELQASCAIVGSWDRPLVDLLVESRFPCWGNMVDDACTSFIHWLRSQHPSPGFFQVTSLPGLPWKETDLDPWEWYARLMVEVANWDPPPLLVDMEEYQITHKDEVLWPPPEQRGPKRFEVRRSRPAGAPFPVGWFGQSLGTFRAGPRTYNCYGPDDLPPVRISFTGNFEWLELAPEHERHIAANLQSTAAALQQLVETLPNAIPPAFVRFFRTPALWRRIRSCTDCYFRLDNAAVGIRGGLGSLVRFMSDSQDCKQWCLHLALDGSHAVVATYHFRGSDGGDRLSGLPHPMDITTVAPSFEAFMYRFWLENEVWFALHDMGSVPPGGAEYLASYSAKRDHPGPEAPAS